MQKLNALVTGASRGIGACIAKTLAQDGYHVLLNYCSNEAKAKLIQQEIQNEGGSAELCGFDVSEPSQVNEKFEWIGKTYGGLSVLVNNAGITLDSLLLRLKDEDLDKALSINLKGAIYCTRAGAKLMLKAKQASGTERSIIHISSVIAETGNAGQAVYAATKSGLIGFSKSIARELASRQIRVNVVTPGYIQTDMTEVLTDTQKEAILHQIPLGFFGTPDDVANLVSFLASPKSKYLTGQVISVNGGMYM
ncbi:MAG: 3-oxoacyl-ACP reductase FabG [Deltaproteobacteria bacterium]|nr:3-oxoacyl-ACP reductase FabG [Deltaproteobacteria bacterium]